jgi:type IV secretory pathway VirB6-like protein
MSRKSESEITVEYRYVEGPDAEPRIQQAFKILFNAAHRPTKQTLVAPLQAVPYAYTEKTACQSLFLSIQVRLKAAVGHPNYYIWRQFYNFHISQKAISIE